MLRLSQLSITQYCCVNCDPGDPREAGEPGCKGQAATQVKWSGVRGHLSSMSGLLIRKCCLSLQGVHRACRVLDAYSQSDINLLRQHRTSRCSDCGENVSGTERPWLRLMVMLQHRGVIIRIVSERKTNSHFSGNVFILWTPFSL